MTSKHGLLVLLLIAGAAENTALATEYPYIFGNFAGAPTQRDLTASAMIRQYIVKLAATGDPNGPGLPRWEKLPVH